MATITRRGKRWFAQVRRLGVSRSKSFGTKLEAQRWALDLEQQIEAGNGQIRPRVTLREVMQDYARDVSPTKRGARWEQIRIQAISRDAIADHDIARITPDLLGQWRDRRLACVSPGSVLRDITILSAVFEYARRERRLIDANPIRDLRKPSAPRARDRIPTEAEIERICLALGLDEAHGATTVSHQVAIAFLVCIETAMRAGEALSLEWDQISTQTRVACLEKTKNGDRREVPLSLRAIELLDQMRGIDPVRVFTVSSASRDALFRKAKKAAGIEGLTFHDSRALALTRLSKVLDPYQLARLAGHRSLDQIMTYYRESAEDIAKKIG